MSDPSYSQYQQNPMMMSNEDSIVARRWESAELVNSLWLALAGKEMFEDNGHVKLRPSVGAKALMNDEGAARVIQVVRVGFINPVMSLTNFEVDDAKTLFKHAYGKLMRAIVLNKEEWGIQNDGDLWIIHSTLMPLLFSQTMRAVNGFEAKQGKTQTIESNQNVVTRQSSEGGFKIPGFGGK